MPIGKGLTLFSLQTRILVTHGITYLPKVDKIIVLVKGTVSEVGTYDELTSHKGAFADFIETYLTETGEESDPDSEGNGNVNLAWQQMPIYNFLIDCER